MNGLEQEMQRRGLLAPAQAPIDPLMAEMQKRGLEIPEQQDKSLWQKAKDAYNGNAEFKDAGNVHDWLNSLPLHAQMKGGFRTAGADMFGNEEDTIKGIKQIDPDAPFFKDVNGNTMFRSRDGKKYYINKPGFDASDALNFGGESGSYLAGGVLTSPFKNLGLRMFATGVTEGGVNAINQKLAGRDDIDKSELAQTAALGAGFEWAGPLIGKALTKIKTKLTGDKVKIELGKKIAGKSKLNDDQLESLGELRLNVDESVPDEALIAQVEHGFKLSRGQATGDLKQLAKEQQLREQPSLMNRFKRVDDFNSSQVEKNLRNKRAEFYGNADDYLEPTTTAEVAQDALGQAEQSAKKEYQKAYNEVGNLYVKKEAAQGLPQRLRQVVAKESQWLDKDLTPKALKAVSDIEKSIKSMGGNVSGFSLKAFDAQRKKINNLFSPTMDKTDKTALTIVKRELDDWFYNSIDDSLLKGDPDALKQLTKARGLMTEYSKRFNSNDNVNKVIKKLVQEQKTPEEFSQLLVGVNGVNKAGSGNLVKAYKNAVGADSEGFKALKAHVFEKIILSRGMKANGETALKGLQGIRTAFNDAFSTKGKTMMKELFTQDEANQIRSLMRSINSLITPRDLVNPSGSGRYVARMVADFGNKLPLVGNLIKSGKDTIQFARSRNLPIKPQDIGIESIMGTGQTIRSETSN